MVNNKMYVFSGFDQPSVHTTEKCEVYDPQTNKWTYVVNMPTPVTHAGAAVDGDKVYISGGFTGTSANSNLLQIYNTTTNTWSNGPVLPATSGGNALVRVGRKLYSFGGMKDDRQTGAVTHFVLDLDAPAKGWTMAAPMPEPRCHFATATVAGKIYALGGQTGHDGTYADVKFVQVYDPVTDTWTRLKDMPYVRSHSEAGSFVIDGKIYLTGGRSGGENILNTVTAYDPETDTWAEQAPLPLRIFGPSGEVIGNELIVSNGSHESRTNPKTNAYKRPIVRTPQYRIGFAPAQLKLSAAVGTSVTRTAVLWTLSGSPDYNITVGSLPAWLKVSPASGIIDLNGGTEVDITADAANLPIGTYNATITARATGYPDAQLPVELKVVDTQPKILYLYGTIPPAIHDMKLSDTGARGMSQFSSAIQDAGFTLTEALDAQITLNASTLAPYKILILGSNNRRFTEAERLAVDSWVKAGGGLVAWSDAAFGWANGGVNSTAGSLSDNDLVQQFGMQFLRDNGVSVFTLKQWSVNHYINRFIKDGGLTIEAEGASPIRTTAPATVIAYLPAVANKLNSLDGTITPADGAISVAKVGQGRVLGLFDRNAFWNAGEGTWLSRVDNKVYAQRLIQWASGVEEAEPPTAPVVVSPVADMTVLKNSAPSQLDLSKVFSDNGAAANLTLTVSGNTNPGLVKTSLQSKTLTLTYTAEALGTAELTIRATDAEGLWVEDKFMVTLSETVVTPTTQEVVSFSLINADTEQEIRLLVAGESLNLATLPTRNLNIRANTNPVTVGSVALSLSGQQTKNVTETSPPYALFGDAGGNYTAWTPAIGSYTLKGTPYTDAGGGGTAGTVLTLSFAVIDQAGSNNQLPIANAGADQTITLPANSLQLAGTGTDADGTISTYTWSQVSGPNTAGFSSTAVENPSLSNLVAGTYTFSLVVKDNMNGLSTPDQVSITVNPEPATPAGPVVFRINAGGSQETNSIGTFAADGYFAGGYIYTKANDIAGTQDDVMYQTERSSTTNNGSFSYDFPVSNGQYKVVLHFADLYWTNVGQRLFDVDLEGTKVLDDYDIVKKAGANFTATTETFTVNVADGTLNILFSALAADGGVDRPKVSAIEILSAPETNVLPTANAGADKTLTLPTNSITLVGSGTDTDGSITAYSWTQQSGPAATLTNANTASLTAGNLAAGSYVFRLAVTDNKGATAFDEVTVTVNNAPVSTSQQLVSFTLINADTEQEIRLLVAGESLNLATLPTRNLNIRANSNPVTVGSVKFVLTGTQNRTVTESGAPYALFGDTNGNYYPWVPAVGTYTLVGTPYTSGGGGGTAGTALSITFQVVNQAARMAIPTLESAGFSPVLTAYPNPMRDGRFQVALPQPAEGEITYELTTITGVSIAKGKLKLSKPESILDLDFSRQMQTSGMYFLRLEGANLKNQLRVVRQ